MSYYFYDSKTKATKKKKLVLCNKNMTNIESYKRKLKSFLIFLK